MEVTNIIDAINTISEKLFKSVEGEVFKGLDNLLIIDERILLKEPLNTLFVKAETGGLVILISSFIIFFLIYFVMTKAISMYNGENTESVFKYMVRVIICVILSTSSIFLCEKVLKLNGIFSNIIANIGKDLSGQDICFENLREVVTNLDKYMSSEALSIDGVIKGVISFGATTILISFAIRYVTLIFLIIVTPIAIMFASSNATYGIFKSWTKLFATNLLIQNIVLIILMIPLALKGTNDDSFKIVLVGSIYLLYRVNNFAKEFLGTISERIIRRG